MTRQDYLKRLWITDPADGSLAYDYIYSIAKEYLEDYPSSAVKYCFEDYIDREEANKRLKERVEAGDDLHSIHEFLDDIEPYDDYFFVGMDGNLLHISEKYARAALNAVIRQIEEEMETEQC